MKSLTLAVLLFFVATGIAAAQEQQSQKITDTGIAAAKDQHPQAILKQFEKQCVDATDNKQMCKCAVKAFKDHVPVSGASFANHPDENIDTQVVRVLDEYVTILGEDVAQCEAEYSQ